MPIITGTFAAILRRVPARPLKADWDIGIAPDSRGAKANFVFLDSLCNKPNRRLRQRKQIQFLQLRIFRQLIAQGVEKGLEDIRCHTRSLYPQSSPDHSEFTAEQRRPDFFTLDHAKFCF
jgi:hypothetical protein